MGTVGAGQGWRGDEGGGGDRGGSVTTEAIEDGPARAICISYTSPPTVE